MRSIKLSSVDEVEAIQVLREMDVPVLAWFYATEGLDDFRGMNIGIIGTPLPPESVYILMAYLLTGIAGGLSLEEVEGAKIQDAELSR